MELDMNLLSSVIHLLMLLWQAINSFCPEVKRLHLSSQIAINITFFGTIKFQSKHK